MAARKSLASAELAERVSHWLHRLSQATPEPASTQPALDFSSDPLLQLSPRKREKFQAAVPLNPAVALLLGFLARRVLALSLSDYDPGQTYGVSVLENLAEAEAAWSPAVCKVIRAEVEALPGTTLAGWTLAGLQLFDGAGAEGLRKRTGSFYTPPVLANRITAQVLYPLDRLDYLVDPACGGGMFLLAALDWLNNNSRFTHRATLRAEVQGSRLGEVQAASSELKVVGVSCLYGLDLNPLAVDLARLALLRRMVELNEGRLLPASVLAVLVAQVRSGNALISDQALGFSHRAEVQPPGRGSSLKNEKVQAALIFNNGEEDVRRLAALQPFEWSAAWPEVFAAGGFDAVLGNPPYVGFNDYSGVEKAYFAYAYPEIYNLKNDLLYYFIVRGVELLRPGGQLGYITARFWKEAVFAAGLRRWLLTNTRLHSIEDFGAAQHFKEAMIDTCLLFLEKGLPEVGHTFEFEFAGHSEQMPQEQLDPMRKGLAWASLRRRPVENALTARLTAQSCPLGQIALCRTGVQTGLDAVFVVDAATAATLEPEVLRRAIKSADIGPGSLRSPRLYLIYPPDDPNNYPRLLAYLEPHRAALLRRRRYSQAFPHHLLQWPRVAEVFDAPRKLVTPYKAPRNTFALDCSQLYFSTDVISVVFTVTSSWLGPNLAQFATNFLNSHLSTFHFRSYSKPVGGGQFDYYANPVKQMAFPLVALDPAPSDKPLLAALAQPGLSQAELDQLAYQLYGLSEAEISLIENSLA